MKTLVSLVKSVVSLLQSLKPLQALTIMAIVIVGMLLAMVWRAWTYHYPAPSERPVVQGAPPVAGAAVDRW